MEPNAGITFNADPLAQFAEWFALAAQQEINDPNAMSLATVDTAGSPRVRIVLLKSFDANGFRFFTNLESDKGREIVANPQVALCFHWKSLQRQVRITGNAAKLPAADDDEYFASRYRISQIGAWASQQSRPLDDMEVLQQRVGDIEQKFIDQTVPRPPHWGGFNIIPQTIEFWAERPYRLHERMLYVRDNHNWILQRLYP